MPRPDAPTRIDRYTLFDAIASGGMATVRLGRLEGARGFGRVVAVKQLHPHLAREPEFARMLADEARIAARLHHPNVVPVLDVVRGDGELLVVMEYVAGASLASLARAAAERGERVDPRVAVTIVSDLLDGLHAAHEARDEAGRPLGVVHRDVSPQNVLVGTDGVARLVDFGVAKAAGRLQTTRDGQLKGKLGYMAPEQLQMTAVDRRADLYAAAVVLWELLVGERLFGGGAEAEGLAKRILGAPDPPSARRAELAPFDDVTLRALDPDPRRRFPTARAMATALAERAPRASAAEVGAWVQRLGAATLAEHAAALARVESPPRARRARPALLALAALAVVATTTAVIAATRKPPRIEPAAEPPIASASAAASAPSPPSSNESPASEAPSSAPAAAEPAAKRDEPTPAVRRSGGAGREKRGPRRAPTSCNPPYTIDQNGLRQYKLECL